MTNFLTPRVTDPGSPFNDKVLTITLSLDAELWLVDWESKRMEGHNRREQSEGHILIWLKIIIMASNYLCLARQWAAVKTMDGEIKDPPQKKFPLYFIAAFEDNFVIKVVLHFNLALA